MTDRTDDFRLLVLYTGVDGLPRVMEIGGRADMLAGRYGYVTLAVKDKDPDADTNKGFFVLDLDPGVVAKALEPVFVEQGRGWIPPIREVEY